MITMKTFSSNFHNSINGNQKLAKSVSHTLRPKLAFIARYIKGRLG